MTNVESQTVKQFLFLRTDLKDFNLGGLLAQVSHASVAAVHKFKEHKDTIKYLENIDSLTTITYGIVEEEIKAITDKLNEMEIDNVVWIENGMIATCIATRPLETSENPDFMEFRKQFKLFKNSK